MSPGPRTLDRVLTGASLAALLVGLFFPVAAKLLNPFYAYAIIVISLPAWAIGVTTAAVAGRRAASRGKSGVWAWTLMNANIAAAFITVMIPWRVS